MDVIIFIERATVPDVTPCIQVKMSRSDGVKVRSSHMGASEEKLHPLNLKPGSDNVRGSRPQGLSILIRLKQIDTRGYDLFFVLRNKSSAGPVHLVSSSRAAHL